MSTVLRIIVLILNAPLTTVALQIVVILILVLAASQALHLVAGRVERRLRRAGAEPERLARVRTLVSVAEGTAIAVMLILALLMVLSVLGISIAPLLAGAGVVGLAISLGAQTLIRDCIGGILILVENQFAVGDVIQVGGLVGTVERISLRVTHLRDADGKLTIVPNGDIRTVSNFSLQWSQATVAFTVPYDADMGRVLAALQEAGSQAAADETVKPALLEPPQAHGWVGLKDTGVQVQLSAKTRPGEGAFVETALRRYGVEALRAAGIRFGQPG